MQFQGGRGGLVPPEFAKIDWLKFIFCRDLPLKSPPKHFMAHPAFQKHLTLFVLICLAKMLFFVLKCRFFNYFGKFKRSAGKVR